MVEQTFGSRPRLERLFQRIQHQIHAHRSGNLPADNTPGKDIYYKYHMDTARPGCIADDIDHLQPVRAHGGKLSIHQFRRLVCSRNVYRSSAGFLNIARSRIYGEYLVVLLITPPSQEMESPDNPGRFTPNRSSLENVD
jgi:hypothetical protein